MEAGIGLDLRISDGIEPEAAPAASRVEVDEPVPDMQRRAGRLRILADRLAKGLRQPFTKGLRLTTDGRH